MKIALDQCRQTVPFCRGCERVIIEKDDSPFSRILDATGIAIKRAMDESLKDGSYTPVLVVEGIDENHTKPDELEDDIWDSTCPLLIQHRQYIDTARDLEVPEDRKQLLRLLGHFAELDVLPCKYEKHLPWITVRHHVLTILAKVDFALLERGIDMLELCKIVNLEYYNRDRDLDLCGESAYLIEYYIDGLPKTAGGGDEAAVIQTPSVPDDLLPLFDKAISDGIISDSYQLITSMAEFVRLCVSMDVLSPWGRASFRRIKNVLTDRTGHPISEIKLAQAYCDAIGKTIKGV